MGKQISIPRVLTFRQANGTIEPTQMTHRSGPKEAAVTSHILIVDGDEAFATILKEGIEMGGEYRATVATTASEARNEIASGHLAMAVVDMGLDADDPLELLKTLRERDPEIRLMVIPLDEVPDEVLALGIQGTLPKPFFLPDIPAQIEGALSRPVGARPAEQEMEEVVVEMPVEAPQVEAPALVKEVAPSPEPPALTPSPELLAHLANESQRLSDHLRYLSRELNADAVLLTYGTHLLAYAGHFGRADAERLAQVVSESWQASVRVAAALGREQVRFEQSLHEGEDYLLYSLAASADIILSVALRTDRPLGMIRYNTKQTAQDLQPILLPR
jgi:DNA-binding response OmpR family regulator/predicted regulator of Ras-like GTPase activity (Roadblock/LC7/MglB family)